MKIQGTKIIIILLLGLTFTLASPDVYAGGSLKKVTMFSPLAPMAAAPFIAEAKGYFKELGLEIDLRRFTSGAAAVEGFLSGNADFVVSGHIPGAKLWNYPDTVGLCPIIKSDRSEIIIAQKNIKVPSDLKGKKIGVRPGSGGQQILLACLKQGGLTEKDVTIKPLSPTEGVAALYKGQLDAFAVWEPYGLQARQVAGDKVHVIFDQRGLYNEIILVSSTKKFVKENHEETLALVKGLKKAVDFINANFDEAVKIESKILGVGEEVPRYIMEICQFTVALTPETKGAMDLGWKFNQEIGAIKKEKSIDWNTMFDPSFLRAIDPKLIAVKF